MTPIWRKVLNKKLISLGRDLFISSPPNVCMRIDAAPRALIHSKMADVVETVPIFRQQQLILPVRVASPRSANTRIEVSAS
jgi:hypothetical protein